MSKKNKVIHVDPLADYTATLPVIFASSRHSMSATELKAFLFFISVTQENTPDDERKDYHEYTFYASELASRLQEDLKKKRPRVIYETFKSLQNKSIEFSDERYRDEEDANRKSYALFSVVDYHGREKNKPLILAIPAPLNQFLYENKKNIPFSFDELNQMSTLNGIRVFMYLKTLSSENINSIGIERFKNDLGFNTKSYTQFGELNRTILKPAEEEIRRYTPYKDFCITHDGSRGRAPQRIYWQFVVVDLNYTEENRVTLSQLEPKDVEKIQKLSKEKQEAIMDAIQAGYKPAYISKLVSFNEDTCEFCANISLAIMQSHSKKLSPDETGRMIWAAVTQNWVRKDSNQKFLEQKKLAHHVKVTQLTLDLGIEQDVRYEENLKKKAMEYFAELSTEEKKDFFIQKRMFILNMFGKKGDFSLEKYLYRKDNGSPDWRHREVKAVRDVIVSMLKNGDLKI